MRRAVLAILPAAVLSGAVAAPSAAASCTDAVRWHATTYVAAPDDVPPPPADAALSGGMRPGCNDVVVVGLDGAPLPDAAPEPDTPVALHAIRGVDSALAVRTTGPGARLYLALGFLPQLAGHPLHRLFPPRPATACTATTRRVHGTVLSEPSATLTLLEGARTIDVLVQRTTTVTAPLRDGRPSLHAGERVTVSGRRCAGSTFVARSIRRTR